MNGLVKRSDVIETANKFSFTDENDRRRYLDFLDYCLKETKTAYNVDAVVEEIEEQKYKKPWDSDDIVINGHLDRAINAVRKGGVNENNN